MISYPNFNPGGFGDEDKDFERFDGFDAGLFSELDGTLFRDELFGRLNAVLNAAAQEAWAILRQKYAKLRENELSRIVLFYCLVFSLKLGLLVALRKGCAYGYDCDEGKDSDV